MGLLSLLGKTIENTHKHRWVEYYHANPKTKLGQITYLLIVGTLLITLSFMMSEALNRQTAYQKKSIQTIGTITKVTKKRSFSEFYACAGRNLQSHLRQYQITLEYRDFEGKKRVSSDFICIGKHLIPNIGERTPLYYLPDKPEDLIMGDMKSVKVSLRLDILVLAISIIGLSGLFFHALYLLI